MKRGFKAEAERKSISIRNNLGVKFNEGLDCFMLAKSLSIPTCTVDRLGNFGLSTELINTICYGKGKQQFSATTISVPNGHIIIYNQTHSYARTNSSLAHEISHILLGHEFSSLMNMKTVSREFDKEKEDEANWLAGCILLPEDGLIWALKRNMMKPIIADHFKISLDMTNWRYNKLGMFKRMSYVKSTQS